MATRAAKSGLARDTQMKMNQKYDEEVATQCLQYIRDMINAQPGAGEASVDFDTSGTMDNLHSVLKDGVYLARFANALSPGSIAAKKYAKAPTMAFKCMELIGLFLDVVSRYGIPDQEKFQTVDLYEKQNLHQVTVCIQSVGRKALANGKMGFGPKEATANPREFDEDTLKAGQNVIGLQYGTNKGASQAGMTMGKQRHIID